MILAQDYDLYIIDINLPYLNGYELCKIILQLNEQVSMVYEPNDKVKDGIYTLIIYNGKVLIGSAQVKLK